MSSLFLVKHYNVFSLLSPTWNQQEVNVGHIHQEAILETGQRN